MEANYVSKGYKELFDSVKDYCKQYEKMSSQVKTNPSKPYLRFKEAIKKIENGG